jgi:hypothetical protein
MYHTLEKARDRIHSMIGGTKEEYKVGNPYFSDWGNRLIIEERPDDWTLVKESKVGRAFDNYECGVATEAQVTLLKEVGWLRY